MRRRRKKMTVSTFPFLAVLLCAMGALILVLVVLDRRAKIAARCNVVERISEANRDREKEIAKRWEEWERQRQQLQFRLEKQQQDLVTAKRTITQEESQTALALAAEKARKQQLAGKVADELTSAEQAQQVLADEQKTLNATTQKAPKARNDIVQLGFEVKELEETLGKLQEARKQSENAYSLVPYKGSQGANRQPIYIEVSGLGVIFHPDGKTFTSDWLESDSIRTEVLARLAKIESASPKKPQADPSGRPYVFLFVRPNGIENYYKAQAAMHRLEMDFGYEFIDQEWAIDFGSRDAAAEWAKRAAAPPSDLTDLPPRRPGAGAGFGTKYGGNSASPGGAPGANGGSGPYASGYGPGTGVAGIGGPPPNTSGSAPNSGKPANVGATAGSSAGANAYALSGSGVSGLPPASGIAEKPGSSASPGGNSPPSGLNANSGSAFSGMPSTTGKTGAPGAGGAGTGAASPSIGFLGAPTDVASGDKPFTALPPSAGIGTVGQAGNGPTLEPHDPLQALPPTFGAAGQRGGGVPQPQVGGAVAGQPGAHPGGAEANTDQQYSTPPTAPRFIAANRPQVMSEPGTGADASAGTPGGAPSAQGGPPALGMPGVADGGRTQDINVPPLPGELLPQITGPRSGDGAPPSGPTSSKPGVQQNLRDRIINDNCLPGAPPSNGNAAPPPQGDGLPQSPGIPASGPMPAQKPTPPISRLIGNRDFIVTVECSDKGVVVLPRGKDFPLAQLRQKATRDNVLAREVRDLIAHRQATVAAGEPPYRPEIRFRIRPEGRRTFYVAYPLLEDLGVSMSREDVE